MFNSSKEYNISMNGRSGLLYSEGKHRGNIEGEMMFGKTDLLLYFDKFNSWLPPFDTEILSAEDRNRIRQNISKSLREKGLNIEWD